MSKGFLVQTVQTPDFYGLPPPLKITVCDSCGKIGKTVCTTCTEYSMWVNKFQYKPEYSCLNTLERALLSPETCSTGISYTHNKTRPHCINSPVFYFSGNTRSPFVPNKGAMVSLKNIYDGEVHSVLHVSKDKIFLAFQRLKRENSAYQDVSWSESFFDYESQSPLEDISNCLENLNSTLVRLGRERTNLVSAMLNKSFDSPIDDIENLTKINVQFLQSILTVESELDRLYVDFPPLDNYSLDQIFCSMRSFIEQKKRAVHKLKILKFRINSTSLGYGDCVRTREHKNSSYSLKSILEFDLECTQPYAMATVKRKICDVKSSFLMPMEWSNKFCSWKWDDPYFLHRYFPMEFDHTPLYKSKICPLVSAICTNINRSLWDNKQLTFTLGFLKQLKTADDKTNYYSRGRLAKSEIINENFDSSSLTYKSCSEVIGTFAYHRQIRKHLESVIYSKGLPNFFSTLCCCEYNDIELLSLILAFTGNPMSCTEIANLPVTVRHKLCSKYLIFVSLAFEIRRTTLWKRFNDYYKIRLHQYWRFSKTEYQQRGTEHAHCLNNIYCKIIAARIIKDICCDIPQNIFRKIILRNYIQRNNDEYPKLPLVETVRLLKIDDHFERLQMCVKYNTLRAAFKRRYGQPPTTMQDMEDYEVYFTRDNILIFAAQSLDESITYGEYLHILQSQVRGDSEYFYKRSSLLALYTISHHPIFAYSIEANSHFEHIDSVTSSFYASKYTTKTSELRKNGILYSNLEASTAFQKVYTEIRNSYGTLSQVGESNLLALCRSQPLYSFTGISIFKLNIRIQLHRLLKANFRSLPSSDIYVPSYRDNYISRGIQHNNLSCLEYFHLYKIGTNVLSTNKQTVYHFTPHPSETDEYSFSVFLRNFCTPHRAFDWTISVADVDYLAAMDCYKQFTVLAPSDLKKRCGSFNNSLDSSEKSTKRPEINFVLNSTYFEDLSHLYADQVNVFLRLLNDTVFQEHEQQCILIPSPGGTGKTTLLKFLNSYFPNICQRTFMVTATTGSAAFQINGTTIHSALGLDTGKDFYISDSRLSFLRHKFRDVSMVIIDEVSRINSNLARRIDYRLRIIRGVNKPFGGLHIIFCGDLGQILPIEGQPFFVHSNVEQNSLYLANLFKVAHLTVCCRNTTIGQIDLLHKIREGRAGAGDIFELNKLINIQLVTPCAATTSIYKTNAAVDTHNSHTAFKSFANVVTFTAHDTVSEGVTSDLALIPQSKTNGLPHTVHLAVGMPIQISRNLDISKGICNGSQATIIGINHVTMEILLKFTNPNVNENMPYTLGLLTKGTLIPGIGFLERTAFPLKVAMAVTLHYSQGNEYKNIHVGCDDGKSIEGGGYTLISRTSNLRHISKPAPFELSDFKTNLDFLPYINSLPILNKRGLHGKVIIFHNCEGEPAKTLTICEKLNPDLIFLSECNSTQELNFRDFKRINFAVNLKRDLIILSKNDITVRGDTQHRLDKIQMAHVSSNIDHITFLHNELTHTLDNSFFHHCSTFSNYVIGDFNQVLEHGTIQPPCATTVSGTMI